MPELLGTPWWAFILLGLFAGMASGTLGIGGGVVMVPVMVALMHLDQKCAQGACLAAMVPIALVGAIRYKLSPGVETHWHWAVLLAAGGVAGVLLGTELMQHLSGPTLRKVFAVVLLLLGLRMLLMKDRVPAEPGPGVFVQAPINQ